MRLPCSSVCAAVGAHLETYRAVHDWPTARVSLSPERNQDNHQQTRTERGQDSIPHDVSSWGDDVTLPTLPTLPTFPTLRTSGGGVHAHLHHGADAPRWASGGQGPWQDYGGWQADGGWTGWLHLLQGAPTLPSCTPSSQRSPSGPAPSARSTKDSADLSPCPHPTCHRRCEHKAADARARRSHGRQSAHTDPGPSARNDPDLAGGRATPGTGPRPRTRTPIRGHPQATRTARLPRGGTGPFGTLRLTWGQTGAVLSFR